MSMMARTGGPPAKPLNFRPTLRRVLGLFRQEALRLGLIMLLAVLAVGLAVAAPKVLGAATDVIFRGVIGSALPSGVSQAQVIAGLRAQGQSQLADMLTGMDLVPGRGIDFGELGGILSWVMVLYALAFVFNYAQGYLSAGVIQRSLYRLRGAVQAKLTRLPLAHFQHQSRGDVLSRVTNDIDNLAQTLTQTLTQILVSLLTIMGVLAMMVSISPLLALIALVTIPISAVITVQIAKRSQAQFVAQWKTTGEVNAHIEEMFTGHEIVKAFGQQGRAIATFAEGNERLAASSARAQFISGIIMPSMSFVSNLNYVAVSVVGAVQVASGLLSIGNVQAFIMYSRQFTQPLAQLGGMINMLQSGLASAERVFSLLDDQQQSPDRLAGDGGPLARLGEIRGRVVFEHVSFRYEPDRPLIEDLSLVAGAGQTVAIVGPTGAGKTTLVNLLMRFYELDAGTISIDGVNIADVAREDLRRQIGMVLQDAWLFGGTIRDNLAYGAPGATDAEIVAAAEATHVDHFVRSLPQGYDTVLSDDGSSLSQGQRQLMTIARAWLANPSILVLDEATSSVDTRTEVLIRQAMTRLRASRTSFVIAHRLSTIRDADLILVMDEGRIVEQGRHEELLAREGFYYRLYMAQFAGPMVDDELVDEATLSPAPPARQGGPQ